jgi:phage anti-repressor protein
MNIQIIKQQFANESINSVSARDLYLELGVKKDFSSWIKVQLKRGLFEENIDFITVPLKGVSEKVTLQPNGLYRNEQGQVVSVDYILTLDTAKEIAMMSGTAKGKEVRNYFIEVEKKFRNGETEKVSLQDIKERTELLNLSEEQFNIFKRVFYEIGITRKEELAITSNRAVKKETGVDFIELAEKKGISTTEKFYTVTELCQKVMNSDKFSEETKKLVSTKAGNKPRPQNLNKILETNGFQTKVDGEWKPTEKGEVFSNLVQNKAVGSDKTVYHLLWKIEVLTLGEILG